MLKKQLFISVSSQDRTGIIADVSRVIYELNGDIADMSQSVLGGFFNMTILARFDKNLNADSVAEKIGGIPSPVRLHCIVVNADYPVGTAHALPGNDVYVVTAQGKNRTGLVAAISSFCSDKGINILGYETKLSKDIYSMMLDISLPSALSPDRIHRELDEMAGELGLKAVMQHKALFTTVNEISLY